MEGMKKCRKCGAVKLKEQFVKRPYRPDGRSAQCRECEKIVIEKRRKEIEERKKYEHF